MATGGEEKVDYSLVNVGTLTLEKAYKKPSCTSLVAIHHGKIIVIDDNNVSTADKSYCIFLVVCQEKIIVIDNTCKVRLHQLHDGKILATSRKLESKPCAICLMGSRGVCLIHGDGLIKMVSIDSRDMSRCLTTTRTLRLHGELHKYHSVVRFKANLIVSGVKLGSIYWCIVSLDDGHIDTIHQICKGEIWSESSVTTKDNIIYISCYADYNSLNNGVYGFNILNPIQCKYKYKHQRLQWPTSIVINEKGNIFVCNEFPDDPSIHQLTASCQLIAIFTQGIPRSLHAIFWDNGLLYLTCYGSRDITILKSVYQGGLIRSVMRSLGLGHSQKKRPKQHSQGEQSAFQVLMSDERKQPFTGTTSSVNEQGVLKEGQSSIKSDMPPSIQGSMDSDNDKANGSVIPLEILRMDDKSIQLYKEALHDGKEKVYNIRLMVVGQYGVGKTTLTKRLLGRHVDISERTSTEGIDVYKHCCKIALDTGEWIIQHADSDQLSRLQRLVKLLTRQTERPEVSNDEVGHTEGIYLRETTEYLFAPHHNSSSDDNVDTSTSSSESDFELESDDVKNQPEESSSFKVDESSPAMEASGVTIQEGGRTVTNEVDATMELLQLIVKKADKLAKNLVENASLALWDFAGQCVFYTTHQTFLTCRAIYLLVTDLSQQVTDLVKDDECYFDTDGVKLCKVQDLVDVWLNSIHCCAQSSTDGTDPKHNIAVSSPAADAVLTSHGASNPGPSIDVGITVTPPVILVGTHVDKIRQDKRQEVINTYFQQICSILKDKPSLQHLVGFLAIDNTQTDPQLEILKKLILKLASRQPHWGEELPANWLPMEEALMKLKHSGIKMASTRYRLGRKRH